MENKEQLLNHYHSRIRKGFPRGEVKAELLAKGFTNEEADDFLIDLFRISSDKSNNRKFDFQMIVTAFFFFYGFYLIIDVHSNTGYWLILSAGCKFSYDFIFGNRKRN